MTTKNKIKISEHFSSIQGEGPSAGQRAIFLRLTGCRLNCFWCDTTEVWKKGDDYTFDQLNYLFETQGYYERLRQGTRLVITGGDPLIQQEELAAFFHYIFVELEYKPNGWMFEVETEGVIMPHPAFAHYIGHWNVSPKLANSGMPLTRRFKPLVLAWHLVYNSFFKFPVLAEKDMDEVDSIVRQVEIPQNKVFLMPICSTRKELGERSKKVVEWALQRGYNFSPRLQLLVWDQCTGV